MGFYYFAEKYAICPMTAGFSLRGLIIALGIVALGLPVALAGLFSVTAQISRYNNDVRLIREAQLNAADIERLQSDEETSVRGYAGTGDPAFRESYRNAITEFPVHIGAVADGLVHVGDDTRAVAALADALAVNARWRQQYAASSMQRRRLLIDSPRAAALVARFRSDIEILTAVLIESYHRAVRERERPERLASLIAYGLVVVVALQILVFAFLFDRLRGELVRERRVITLLQRAFTSEMIHVARLDVAAVYVSATRGATVGGDVYDIFPLDANRTLIVIADISGKGVEAAVDSSFVKYSLRAFASEHADIATIVTKFNMLYGRAQKPPEAFVEVFAAIFDNRTTQLSYVNAGHESAYVKRPFGVEQLAPTGMLIGIDADLAFASAQTTITSDDVLFLSTDGLTEARDPSGTFLTAAGVKVWLGEADSSTAQRLVDALSRRLRRFTRDRSRDDLAMLAMRPKG